MAISMNSPWGFSSAVKLNCVSRSCRRSVCHSIREKPSRKKIRFPEAHHVLFLGRRSFLEDVRWGKNKIPLAMDSSEATEESSIADSVVSETTTSNNQSPPPNTEPDKVREGSSPPAEELTPKKSLLTARERLRAARVLSRYTDSKPSKPEYGSTVLDALRESDKGKKRSGLPEAPTNLFDDSKRGMPKQGLTFSFPGGNDLLLIIFSFVFISTVMFTTTYVVWKLGAIHFNEY